MGALGTTAGPLTLSPSPSYIANEFLDVVNGDGAMVARLFVTANPNAAKDAAQLAASPDLHDQLTFAVKLLDAMPGFRGTAQLDRMHAALAKARGES